MPREKDRRGLLDLRRSDRPHPRPARPASNAAWVHYKLDLGIDHVLIDEAQDTSPEQWDIIKRFVAEFTAGAGARGDVEAHDLRRRRREAVDLLIPGRGAGSLCRDARLLRTRTCDAGAAVPSGVAATLLPLGAGGARRGRHGVQQPAAHSGPDRRSACRPCTRPCARPRRAWSRCGRWSSPTRRTRSIPGTRRSTSRPSDQPAGQAGAADRRRGEDLDRARRSGRRWRQAPCGARRRHLILVRQRGPLFEAIIRALKHAGIPVAGADRLVLTEHIAVMDLLVLADALLHAATTISRWRRC